MCDKAVDAFLPALKLVTDWFVKSKMIKRIDNAIFSNNYIIFVNEDANRVNFFSGEMVLFSVDHNKINLDVHDFDEDDPKTIIHVRPIAWRNRFQKKHVKKA